MESETAAADARASDQQYIIEPSPERVYPSRAEAENAFHAWAYNHGFNVSKRSVNKLPDDREWGNGYDCDRAGKPKNTRKLKPAQRVRPNVGSKRIGCKMHLRLRAADKRNPEGPWRIDHARNESDVHNHPPSDDVRVHAAHRRRAAAAIAAGTSTSLVEIVESQAVPGVPTSSIYASILHQNPSAAVLPKDVANAQY